LLRRPLAALVALACMCACALPVATASAANPIETNYSVNGSWPVTTGVVNDASGTAIYNLYYPSNLGNGGYKHPIVTWGNGTNAVPSQYSGLLNRLASWGFVVVASTSKTTGKGTEITAGANYLVAQNGVSTSPFFNKLDTTAVAAVGHSQGAGGSTRATIANPALIKTLVTIALPAQAWVSAGDEYNPAQITRPVLFLGGANDWLISSPSTNTGYYNQVPGPAAVAVLKGADHNTIQGTGGKFPAYITAWLLYQLKGDALARGAFVGSPPEINANTGWQNQAEKQLP
jgi:hypothetical protein